MASGRRPLPVRLAQSPALLGLVWLVTRLLEFHQWWTSRRRAPGDVLHYWVSMHGHSLGTALPEYPLPVAWLMEPMKLLAGSSLGVFGTLFTLLMSAVDIAAIVLLWRRGSRLCAWCWMLFGALVGCQLIWFRFDVLTAALVMAALLVRRRHPAWAGALLAVGTAFKLWPVLLLAAMWRRGKGGRRLLAGTVGTGAAILLLGLVTAGWDRLVSPLRWQQDRGLQIESIAATPIMLMRARRLHGWRIGVSKYLAYEIWGPHVHTALQVASALNLLMVVLALAVFVNSWRVETPRTLRETRADDAHMAMACAALIGAFIVANKTFSPQYLYWLMAPAVVVLMHRRHASAWRARCLMLLLLVAAALTGWIFPYHYNPLHWMVPAAVGVTNVLAVRNLLVVVIAVLSAAWVWRVGPSARIAPDSIS